MVFASQGVLVTTDVPTKELLVYENNKAAPTSKFIITVLDDTHILVKPDFVGLVKDLVKDFNNRNVYQPPIDKDEAAKRQ
ncbi:hypothetical protein Rsub_03408 [Raphidocelis subcapitata]|uniref:General transcription and DNA repair factor IIH subunit TFB5 n=1 Tax=Raphidocelis subcapitata TaxID=307507 RepID=A0A2V0NUR3_9CHLO|nr:hypothetical protein Rsub_03408 [Raphidocelis subcapitata]|eukprot:GBF90412.1 hypothetical protein Rsub_03408 [Raphidocelis subcapitata]